MFIRLSTLLDALLDALLDGCLAGRMPCWTGALLDIPFGTFNPPFRQHLFGLAFTFIFIFFLSVQ